MLCKGWDGFHTRRRDEENIYTKIKRKRKNGISQARGNMGSLHFYLSKCHFGGADLGGFSIRKLSGFSCNGCTVPAGLGFSRPCIFVFPLPLRGHFAFSFFAHRLSTFSFCTRGLVRFQSVATAWKVGGSVD